MAAADGGAGRLRIGHGRPYKEMAAPPRVGESQAASLYVAQGFPWKE